MPLSASINIELGRDDFKQLMRGGKVALRCTDSSGNQYEANISFRK